MAQLTSKDSFRQIILDKMPAGPTRGVFLSFIDDAPVALDTDDIVDKMVELSKYTDDDLFLGEYTGYKKVLSMITDGGK